MDLYIFINLKNISGEMFNLLNNVNSNILRKGEILYFYRIQFLIDIFRLPYEIIFNLDKSMNFNI